MSALANRYLAPKRALFAGIGSSLATQLADAHGTLIAASAAGRADEAVVVLLLAAAALMYGAGLMRLSRRTTRGRRVIALRAGAFAGGLAMVGAALLPPLDRWGAELFTLHMIQHELLMLVAAPLLVIGHPLPVFLWAFGARGRARVTRLSHAAPVRTAWRAIISPPAAWFAHALVLWIWHFPRFFDAVLRSDGLHELQHLSFLISALAFWTAMVETRRQEQQGAAILYLFTTTVHTGVLGALITFASHPWYAAYLQTPGNWGLSALEDQQLGGLIMWVPGSLVYVGIALALLARWIRSTDSAAAAR